MKMVLFHIKALHFTLITIALNTLSCTNNDHQSDDTKLLDYKYFTIRVPQSWKRVPAKSIDSFVGEIHPDATTVLSFDLGWYSNKLNEDDDRENYMIEKGDLYVADSIENKRDNHTSHWIYFARADSVNIERVRLSRVEYTRIDGRKAKLVIAKKPGTGTTGIYIDSLWRSGKDNDRFQLNGHNLTRVQQQQLLKAIKTLKFYQHPAN